MNDGEFCFLLLLSSTLLYAFGLAIPFTVFWELAGIIIPSTIYPAVILLSIALFFIIAWKTYTKIAGWLIEKLGGERLKRILNEEYLKRRL